MAARADVSIVVVVAVWVLTSVLFNITSPKLLRLLPDAEDMTLIELVVTVVVGAVNLRLRNLRLFAGGIDAMPFSMALGSLHLLNCRTFCYSLQFIPVALAQTIRATNPMWVVLISGLLGRHFGLFVLASLGPLIGGFALAVGTEANRIHSGGLAGAVCSVNAQVCVNLLSKEVMNKEEVSSEDTPETSEIHAFEIQFQSCLFALVTLTPIWILYGGPWRLASHWAKTDSDAKWAIVLFSSFDGVLYFAEQAASFTALGHFRPLSFAVIDTVRRLSIVMVAGYWVQGTPLTAAKALGVALVLAGGLCYADAKDRDERQKLLPGSQKSPRSHQKRKALAVWIQGLWSQSPKSALGFSKRFGGMGCQEEPSWEFPRAALVSLPRRI